MGGVAEEAEVAEATIEEVLGGEPADLLVVGHNSGHRQVGEDPRDVDHGLAEP